MEIPVNVLKRALREGKPQVGIWASFPSHATVEVIAGSGFDWLVLDTEHAATELGTVHNMLQAMVGGTASPVVRPAWNDAVLLKKFLDLGVQNFLVPMVQDAEEARRAVAATRYPPQGVRGVAVSIRANHFGRVKDYHRKANEQICVQVQIETQVALDNLEEIAAVDGVDGCFIGPSDLAADLGHLGDSGHADVRAAIERAGERIRKAGKAAGILAPIEADARHWLSKGFTFVGVGADVGILARNSEALAAKFK
jgi:4-hydroxy-2-oxoheptanedioate aldolase